MDQALIPVPERRGPSAKIKKPRGRPPANTQEETSANRRRLQLRQAQRAYRQRKDDKISTLERKIELLQSVAKNMNDSFLQFGSRAIASSTLSHRPKLESELKATAATLTALCDAATAVHAEDPLNKDNSTAPPPPSTITPSTSVLSSQTYRAVTPDNPSPTSQLKDTGSSQALPFGYMRTYEISDGEDGNAEVASSDRPPPLIRALQPPYTYSFRERSFATRLERAAIERGVYLLSNLHIRPAEFQRSYRICRHFCTRDTLLTRFREALAKPFMTSFGNLTLSLGGAGSHFPRSRNGNNAFHTAPAAAEHNLSNTRAVLRSFGLHSTPELEEDLHHYDGIWFDSQDVEGYLTNLGVNMDAHGSLAEVEMKALKRNGISLDHQRVSRPAGAAERQGPLRARLGGTHFNTSSTVAGVMPGVTVQVAKELREEEWDRFCEFSTPWLADPMASCQELSGRDWGEGIVMIDLGRLVNGLIKRGVCIGRGPGFRLADVHNALRTAIIND